MHVLNIIGSAMTRDTSDALFFLHVKFQVPTFIVHISIVAPLLTAQVSEWVQSHVTKDEKKET